ncbi:hypothetical protein TIFTF001_000699 [Ficus carica]|uniref:Uncharacterized protein n=1 Tax=Ficus carica TaxID=3494 RepID=A0AA87YVX6_FICCA|nr:hypothetical protein TIFTF001_000699 [Ficus carica]
MREMGGKIDVHYFLLIRPKQEKDSSFTFNGDKRDITHFYCYLWISLWFEDLYRWGWDGGAPGGQGWGGRWSGREREGEVRGWGGRGRGVAGQGGGGRLVVEGCRRWVAAGEDKRERGEEREKRRERKGIRRHGLGSVVGHRRPSPAAGRSSATEKNLGGKDNVR